MNLERALKKNTSASSGFRPTIFNLAKAGDKKQAFQLIKKNKVRHIIDDFYDQLKEYFQILNPALVYSELFEKSFAEFLKARRPLPLWQQGRWVYFPWMGSLVHILPNEAYQKVRMARNRNLINETEQEKFYNSAVGIAGLSVGNSAALAIVLQGGARHIKLADHDRLALSNINRIRSSIADLGLLKAEMTARQIYELNPYAKVEIFPQGLNEKNVSAFCKGLDVIVDEVDSLAVKYLLREQAKKRRLPVVMAADNGDSSIVDIERYDKNPKLKFFHGRLGKISYQRLKNLNKFQTGQLITRHLGQENVTRRMHESLAQMGKTIVSWPQLGGAALLNGSAIAYCVRKILNNQPLESNRAIISLDKNLNSRAK